MDFREALVSSLPTPDALARMPRAGIVTAIADVDDWRPWLPSMPDLLEAPERERIGRKRVAADAETSLLAHALLRQLLALAEGGAGAPPLWRDGNDKPRVGNDEWHVGMAHAGQRVLIGLGRAGPLGVDIEPRMRTAAVAEIAERICHASERAALADLSEAARAEALLALWVRKEALLKADGIGLGREMDDFAAPPGRPLPLASSPQLQVWVHMLRAGTDWLAAIAAPVPVAPPRALHLRPGAALR